MDDQGEHESETIPFGVNEMERKETGVKFGRANSPELPGKSGP